MSWSDRGPTRRAAFCAFAALAGLGACGFAPAYGPGGGGAALDGQVAVVTSGGTLGFTLTQELQNRFGPAAAPSFRLTHSLGVVSERVAVTTAQSTNRFNLIGAVDYVLFDIATGEIVMTGRADAFVGYDATGTTVATRAAERDAQTRLMVMLADRIVASLIARIDAVARAQP